MSIATPVTDLFGFHRTAIVRWVREYRKNGKLEPKVRGHMARAFFDEERAQLANMVEDKPDLTLEEIRAYDAMEKGIASAFDMVCTSDAQGWFKNCRYELFQA